MTTPQSLKDFLQGKTIRLAAVLLLQYKKEGEDSLIFTRRTEEVEHHKGQISFPGGAADPDDASLWQTALRETNEELGIDAQLIQQQQELAPRLTPTGFKVTPFVGTLSAPPEWNCNRFEIAEVFSVPCAHLQNQANLTWRSRQLDTFEYIDPLFTYRHYEIWGLTARILCEFFGHPFPKAAL